MLLLAESDAQPSNAVASCRPAQQPAPPAPDVQQPVSRSEPELAADMVELVFLRLVNVFRSRTEIGARINHVSIEPEPIEVVRHIVVTGDCGRVTLPGMSPWQGAQQGGDPPRQGRPADPFGKREPDLQ